MSGFLSELITTVMNVFTTTGKRAVRLIREGALSLVKAFMLALSPKPGQTYAESFHEASKILFSGVVVIVGILLTEVVEKAIMAFLPGLGVLIAPLANAICAAFSALAAAIGCYLLDKVDLFGAVKREEDRFVLERLKVTKEEKERFWALSAEVKDLQNNAKKLLWID